MQFNRRQNISNSRFQVVTLATRECAAELALMHDSLRAFHPPDEVPLVVGCSSELMQSVFDGAGSDDGSLLARLRGDDSIQWIPCLDVYGKINRGQMERQPGVWFPTRHCDFMMEKANVMDFALQRMGDDATSSPSPAALLASAASPAVLPPGVLYVDSDITFLDSLHGMFADDRQRHDEPRSHHQPLLGVSPHQISAMDERLFGKYNGGMLFAAHPVVLWHWRRATHASRYFDQASIEDVVEQITGTEGADAVVHFGPHVNYGFWRLFQSPTSVEEQMRRFSLGGGRSSGSGAASGCAAAIRYDGRQLQSVHTHWFMRTPSREIPVFNALLRKWVMRARAASPGAYRGLALLCV